MASTPMTPVRPNWRHRIVARYYRASEHPARLRLLRWTKRLLRVNIVQVEVFPGVIMELDDADYVNREILFQGGYEVATLRLFDRLLSKARGFVDIGAHHGQYTLRAARTLAARHGRVLAFEPTPANAARLLRNAQLSAVFNFELFALGLSDSVAVRRIVLPFSNNTGGAHLGATAPAVGEEEAVPVYISVWPIKSLAARIPPESLDLVKIDVEGHERSVLASLFESALPKPPNLLMEFLPEFFDYGVPEGLPAWLASHGYDLRTVEGAVYRPGQPLPENNLWAQLRV